MTGVIRWNVRSGSQFPCEGSYKLFSEIVPAKFLPSQWLVARQIILNREANWITRGKFPQSPSLKDISFSLSILCQWRLLIRPLSQKAEMCLKASPHCKFATYHLHEFAPRSKTGSPPLLPVRIQNLSAYAKNQMRLHDVTQRLCTPNFKNRSW